jgi:UDP-N-acetyl-D-mannosaminuronic acid dehydrogenase
MRAARLVNDGKPDWVVAQVKKASVGISNPTICLLGLAYKENVDDFRESPSVTVADKLIESKVGKIVVVEPFMKASAKYDLVSLEEGIKQADVIVHLTAHDAFKNIARESLAGKKMIDTRGSLCKSPPLAS